jgi:monoamine oxidase
MLRHALHWLSVAVLALVLHHPARGAPEPRIPVLIIGGGAAGMATAWHLQKAGIDFQLVEMAPRLGGRVRTASYPDGARAEAGLEEFWEGNLLLEILRELKLPLEKSASSFSSFAFEGKIYPFTQDTNTEFLKSVLSGAELQAYQSWDAEAGRILKTIGQRPIPAETMKLKDLSFDAWVMQKKFRLSRKAQQFIRLQSEPEYGTSWSRISALDGIAEWRIFHGAGTGSFHLVNGNQSFVQAIADKLGASKFRLNTQVTNINLKDDHVEVVATDTSTFGQKIFRAEHVVSTIPLFRLNEIHFSPELSAKRQEAIQTQSWGSYFTAHVLVDRDAEKFWKPLGQDALPILTGSSIGVVYEGDSAEKTGSRLMNLLVTGDYGEAFNARTISFDTVGSQIRAGFEKLWPGFSKHIRRMTFYRYHPRAIAGWPVGRSRFDALSDLMRTPEGRLHFAGDFTEGTHSDDAAQSALRVVRQITEARRKK